MRETHLTTVADVLSALGTTAEVMELTGTKTPQAVYNWGSEERGYFPAGLFLVMTTALAAKGLTADPALWRQHPTSGPGVEAAQAAPAG